MLGLFDLLSAKGDVNDIRRIDDEGGSSGKNSA